MRALSIDAYGGIDSARRPERVRGPARSYVHLYATAWCGARAMLRPSSSARRPAADKNAPNGGTTADRADRACSDWVNAPRKC